jgi:hypothetical protein
MFQPLFIIILNEWRAGSGGLATTAIDAIDALDGFRAVCGGLLGS